MGCAPVGRVRISKAVLYLRRTRVGFRIKLTMLEEGYKAVLVPKSTGPFPRARVAGRATGVGVGGPARRPVPDRGLDLHVNTA